ncbi:MAG TPA: bacillithiol biosynthesis cysteine-adding enzyme BshC [Bryobacteraceae bacterium]|nr:bacillithiol biosynthesis cysteine-adding enzyme BshC [Bryobacteraceae bacterium]
MMESACLRHTEIPHTSQLFSDFQYHFDRVARFYAHNPHDGGSYAAAAAEMDYPEDRRAALVDALRASNKETQSLDLLARPGTVAVVTGQQVGLFSGPAYTIYKALTATRLAAQLTEQGIPAVPIFWLATEDHDVAEVNHTFAFGPDHRPIQLSVNANGGADRPVGGIAISSPPVDRLREVLAGFPYGDDVADLVRASYPDGVTFGNGFRALLQRLLEGRGILFVDPMDEAVRRLAAPLLAQAVRQDEDLHSKLIARGKELEGAGYHTQVHLEAKTSLVFLLDGDRRIALRRQNGEYAAKATGAKAGDRKFSAAELEAQADRLSPNALLRPVMQDYVLPTVAYVGGPAELAYLAQSQVLYRELLGRMPVMMSRGGFTLVDARTAKLLDRYRLPIPALFHGEEAVRDRVARTLVPPELSAEIEDVRKNVSQAVERLRDRLTAFDKTLADAAGKSSAKMLYQLGKIEHKTAREMLKRNERAQVETDSMCGLVFPNKHLQERYYSILPFLARHGVSELMDTLYGQLTLACPDHRVLVV